MRGLVQWVNATPRRQSLFRFVRVFLATVVPTTLAFLAKPTGIPFIDAVPLVAVAAGILNVLWREYDPLDGTSQLGRFVRTALFTGVPQFVAVALSDKPQWVLVAGAISAALEQGYRAAVTSETEDSANTRAG